MANNIQGDAIISACGKYRHQLRRWWTEGCWCLWIMLNPSTADALQDDATITDISNRTMRWAIPDWCRRDYPPRKARTNAHTYYAPFGGLIVGNLYAWRETDPFHMWAAQVEGEDIVGAETDQHLQRQIALSHAVICAWGNGPIQLRRQAQHQARAQQVVQMIRDAGREPLMLNVGKSGHPRHPLYWPADAQPSPFAGYAA